MNNVKLTTLKSNQSGIVVEILDGCKARKRLYELGINKGSKVKMMKNDLGPLILNLSGSKLALGRGIAENIIVKSQKF